MAVRGTLKDMSLASHISINCNEMRQAYLRIEHQGQEGSIYFSNGDIVHAQVGSQVGDEAVYKLLTWEDGDFELEMDVEPPARSITDKWSSLLLEGMRRIDEETAGLEWLDDIETREGEEVRGEAMQELARALEKIEGVVGVVIAARDGIVLAESLEGDPQKEGAVTVFVGNAAGQAGESLALGSFDWGTVAIGKDTMMVLEQAEYYVGLLLGERASPAIVASHAERVLN